MTRTRKEKSWLSWNFENQLDLIRFNMEAIPRCPVGPDDFSCDNVVGDRHKVAEPTPVTEAASVNSSGGEVFGRCLLDM